MKTKLNLLLTAVMLLLSANVFAQSGSIDPGKGDVNGDGVVDVADITAVASIMRDGGGVVKLGYFYLGTTAPTAENYRALPGVVTSLTSIDEAVGTEAAVAAGQTLYMMCPTAWVTGKSVAVETQSGKTIHFLEEVDVATVSGYSIYKTQVLDASSTVTLKTPTAKLYFSVGLTEVTSSNYTTANNATTTIPTTYEFTNNSGARNYVYVLIPSTKSISSIKGKVSDGSISYTEQSVSIPNHKVYRTGALANGSTMIITIQ